MTKNPTDPFTAGSFPQHKKREPVSGTAHLRDLLSKNGDGHH